MISENKKLSAFDVVEAVCLMSDLYEEYGIDDRIIQAHITAGRYPSLYVLFGKHKDNGEFEIQSTFNILLDEKHTFGDTFSAVSDAIKKEMERVTSE